MRHFVRVLPPDRVNRLRFERMVRTRGGTFGDVLIRRQRAARRRTEEFFGWMGIIRAALAASRVQQQLQDSQMMTEQL